MRKGIVSTVLCMMTAAIMAGTVLADTDISQERINHLAEVSGVNASNVFSILNEAGITSAQLDQMSETEIIEGLQMKSSENNRKDYGYLFSDDSVRQTLDQHELLRVAVFSSDDAIHPSLLIDYENKKIYYSGGIRFFDNLDKAENVTLLDDATADAVRKIVREILEKGYDDLDNLLQIAGGNLAGLAVETDYGVTSFIIQDVQNDTGLELSNYVSQIFRIYYDKTGY